MSLKPSPTCYLEFFPHPITPDLTLTPLLVLPVSLPPGLPHTSRGVVDQVQRLHRPDRGPPATAAPQPAPVPVEGGVEEELEEEVDVLTPAALWFRGAGRRVEVVCVVVQEVQERVVVQEAELVVVETSPPPLFSRLRRTRGSPGLGGPVPDRPSFRDPSRGQTPSSVPLTKPRVLEPQFSRGILPRPALTSPRPMSVRRVECPLRRPLFSTVVSFPWTSDRH